MLSIALALAMAAMQDRAAELRKLEEVTEKWMSCADRTAVKWSVQAEGADTIATAAMAECHDQQEMFDAEEQLEIVRSYQKYGANITPATFTAADRIIREMHDRVHADLVALVVKTRAATPPRATTSAAPPQH